METAAGEAVQNHVAMGLIQMLLAVIVRAGETIVPEGDVVLLAGDKLVLGAEHLRGAAPVELREIVIGEHHRWNGFAVGELDISRKEYVVLVKRDGRKIVPRGSLILREGDNVFLYREGMKREHRA